MVSRCAHATSCAARVCVCLLFEKSSASTPPTRNWDLRGQIAAAPPPLPLVCSMLGVECGQNAWPGVNSRRRPPSRMYTSLLHLVYVCVPILCNLHLAPPLPVLHNILHATNGAAPVRVRTSRHTPNNLTITKTPVLHTHTHTTTTAAFARTRTHGTEKRPRERAKKMNLI